MKKLLLLFLLFPLILNAQKNTLYLTFAPTDLGIGMRYDRQISDMGLYGSASWGNYYIDKQRINNHVKLVLGAVKYCESKYYDFTTVLYSAGISYHYYGNELEGLNGKVFAPVSIDLGTGIRIKRFNAGFCFDFFKGEGVINFGYSF